MPWKKRRRRYPGASLGYACAACLLIFVFGNLLLLNSEFMQLYENTARDIRASLKDHWPWRLISGEGDLTDSSMDDYVLRHGGWMSVDGLKYGADGGLDGMETRLRKLMQNRRSHSVMAYHIPSTSFQYKSGKDHLYAQYITASHVRQALWDTSTCSEIYSSKERHFISSGWTKAVYKISYRGKAAALKLVDLTGHDIVTCTKQQTKPPEGCYSRASQKIIREILLLQGLIHPNIIKVFGHCVPRKRYNGDADSQVSMVTELGDTIDIIKLLQLSWEDRLRICYGVSKLVSFLANSPYGSLSLNDFRRQQFVLVNGEVKLTDLDDVGFGEVPCSTDSDCDTYFSAANVTVRAQCKENQCHHLNERKNIFNAARHFLSFLLPHGAPATLKTTIERLLTSYNNISKSAKELMEDMTRLVELFRSGKYLRRRPGDSVTHYKVFAESDLPGLYDYSCRYSMNAVGCTVSVFDQREAEDLCDADPACHGFVVSGVKTWTGRYYAHLKNSHSKPSYNNRTTLYLKPHV